MCLVYLNLADFVQEPLDFVVFGEAFPGLNHDGCVVFEPVFLFNFDIWHWRSQFFRHFRETDSEGIFVLAGLWDVGYHLLSILQQSIELSDLFGVRILVYGLRGRSPILVKLLQVD
jgi:hypothetical protein